MRMSRTIRLLAVFVLALAVLGAAGWFWHNWASQKMLESAIANAQREYPGLLIEYKDARVSRWSKSLYFDDLTMSREGKTLFRAKQVSFLNLESQDDVLTNGDMTFQNFAIQSGNRTIAGDMKFHFTATPDAGNYAVRDFFFENLADKSSLKWQAAEISNIRRNGDKITNYDFNASGIDIRIDEKTKMGGPDKIEGVAVKFSFARGQNDVIAVNSFQVSDKTGKFLFGVDKISTQVTDKNFGLALEKVKLPAEYNPMSSFGYGEFVLNFAISGTAIADAASNPLYQLRQETFLQDGFHLKLMANLHPDIFNFGAESKTPDQPAAPVDYGILVRSVVLEYRDLSLLNRIYDQMGRDAAIKSWLQQIDVLAEVYRLNNDPYFTASLANLRGFIAQPGNIRISVEPNGEVGLADMMMLGMSNPPELMKKMRLQIVRF